MTQNWVVASEPEPQAPPEPEAEPATTEWVPQVSPIDPAEEPRGSGQWAPIGQFPRIEGAPGEKGDPGPPGPPGPPGDSPGVVFAFIEAAREWHCNHGLGKREVTVDTADTYGRRIEGDVQYLDENNVAIHWFYPTAGTVRVSL